ncbi:conserved hypothetical protein [Oenococcus oeni]|nr:conserved hypothetical protein [Oenococcus oeni]SYW00729.1 conserved hypothetical protein [Oenococcus oeni]SYW02546.1 conserved hypothetical protein [Oenococcus oeni]SYW18914.1 conserved hypothetical protein [Oenococcus oeni]
MDCLLTTIKENKLTLTVSMINRAISKTVLKRQKKNYLS